MNGMILECTCTLISVLAKDFVDNETNKHIVTHKGNFEADGEIYTFTVDERIATEIIKYRYQPVKIKINVNSVNGRNYLKVVSYEVLKK